MPNRTFIVRQVRIAASPHAGCRPRLPVGFAAHAMSGSNQIVGEPQRLSASLHAGQFSVLWIGVLGLLMAASYHAGFTR
jgi:hypothetical protein